MSFNWGDNNQTNNNNTSGFNWNNNNNNNTTTFNWGDNNSNNNNSNTTGFIWGDNNNNNNNINNTSGFNWSNNNNNNTCFNWSNNTLNNDDDETKQSESSVDKMVNITFTDIALAARINKNATNLIYGYVGNKNKIIPSEIFTIILAFFPSEIPFYDHVFEIQIIGSCKVGKSSLCNTKEKILKINRNIQNDEIVQLRLYDVDNALDLSSNHNQINQHNVSPNYFGDAVIIMFDVSNRKSFTDLTKLSLQSVSNQNDIIKLLVGNKCDIIDQQRKVTLDEANEYAQKVGIEYMEISTKEDINISTLFEKISIKIANEYENNHNLFLEQWKTFKPPDDHNNDNDDNQDIITNTENIGTRKYYESNDFVAFKQTDPNRTDRVYHYQNICLMKTFQGKSPEELRFEDKYDECSVNINQRISWPRITNKAWNQSDEIDEKKDETNNDIKREPTKEEKAKYVERLQNIYRVHNKEKLNNAPNLLDKYGKTLQKMHELYIKVCKKYNVEPQEIFISTSTSKPISAAISTSISRPSEQIKEQKQSDHVLDIDKYIIHQVAIRCDVSTEIAKHSLESSLWISDIAINKINSLRKLGYDFSITSNTTNTANEANTDRAATNEEITVYQTRLRKIYEMYNKEKLCNVTDFINKHKHKLSLLHELYFRVCLKYQVSPQNIFISKVEIEETDTNNNKNDALILQKLNSMEEELKTVKLRMKELESKEDNALIIEENTEISQQNAESAYSLLFGSQ